MSETKILWELKEKAKRSHDTDECKMAVSEPSKNGAKALHVLKEVLKVVAYKAVRTTYIGAIIAVREKQSIESTDTKKTNVWKKKSENALN